MVAILPLAVLFLVFQIFLLNLPRNDVRKILIGTLVATAGLFLFLLGLVIGFLPFGRVVGQSLGSLEHRWLLLPAGLFLGFVTTWGEPAVRILADQVDDASNGSIRRDLVLYAVCIGVSVLTGFGLLRIAYEISLLHLLVPGYALVIVIMWFSDRDYVAIAVDAGGVATGPLANTFLLALALGVSASMGSQNPVVHGLGLVALIALAPIISVMVLGLFIRWNELRQEHRKGEKCQPLIVSIVRKGWGNTALDASIKAGATGGTVLPGRGIGVNEKDTIFGISIEPEKEILLTLTPASEANVIMEAIIRAVKLDESGNGLAFIVPIEKIVGVPHLPKHKSE